MRRLRVLRYAGPLLLLCLITFSVVLGQGGSGESSETFGPDILGEEEYQRLKAEGLLPQPTQVGPPATMGAHNIIEPAAIERGGNLLVPLDQTFQRMPSSASIGALSIARPGPDGRDSDIPGILYFIEDVQRQGTPDEIARAYLSTKVTELRFKSDLSDLVKAKTQESPMGFHVTYEQTIDGIPVYRSNVVVTIDQSNRVVFVSNDYKPDLALATTLAAVGSVRAMSVSMSHLGVEETLDGFPTSRLIVYAEEETPRLAYEVTIASRTPSGSWAMIIDAQTGDVVSVVDLRVKVDGTGLIFDPDPITSASATYGDPGFVDNGDASSPELAAQRVGVTLRDITLDGSDYKLEGPNCVIEDWHVPNVAPATETDPNNFQYTRDQSGFEDVMVYYHMDQIARYMQGLGFSTTGLATNVDPHGWDPTDPFNSFFDPAVNKIAFGEEGVDHAEDADVIWHEVGHAIQEAQAEWHSKGGEARHIGEGFSDYWAGSYSRNGWAHQSDWVYNWMGHNEYWNGRVLNDATSYPAGGVVGWDIYTGGTLWASVLMEIWDVAGREVLDKCILQSHYLLGSNPTMRYNAAAILQVNRSVYGGANVREMCGKFEDRGILNICADGTFAVAPFTNGAPPEYRNDDGSTSLIPLSFPFCFYGTQYNQVYINNNGNLSFDAPYFEFTPAGFPIFDFAMVAPFWADIDTRASAGGVVYYKSEPNRLTVIWDGVGYYSGRVDKLNTFEVVITDGNDPLIGVGNNVAFSYSDMQWTTGEASDGLDGFGGAPATVGVNQGDGVNYALVGRFDHAGSDYDGPGGNPDGVSYIDWRDFTFDVCQGLGTIAGVKFNDGNGNGVRDVAEDGLAGWTIRLEPGGHATTTDANGEYFFSFLDPNTYTASEILRPNWDQTFPAPPGEHVVNLTLGGTVTGINFGNHPVADIQDLGISVAGGRARPGFQKFYGITYENKGTVTTAATASLALPTEVSHLQSSPGGVYGGGHTVTWNLGNLSPGFVGWLWTKVQIPPTITLGAVLTSSAHIEPLAGDAHPADNTDSESQVVTGSFDPNDKAVVPEGDIIVTDLLTYQVNFQNVGTDTAFTIIIRDSLDQNLDISTVNIGASSHPYVFFFTGRELVWEFQNVLLPDSNVNEPGSHGFVKFTALPLASLAEGDSMENRAAIYFDFNPAVVTNTVVNRISNEDTEPPTISVVLNRDALWPPNHKMVPIVATIDVEDNRDTEGAGLDWVLESITSDEPDNGKGDGNTIGDIAEADTGTTDIEFKLRSERSGKGDGRKYTIIYRATDSAGNAAWDTVCVDVHHDQSAAALASTGYNESGTAIESGARELAIVIPSRAAEYETKDGRQVLINPPIDATLIPVAEAYVGNAVDAVVPIRSRTLDVTADGMVDLVVWYPASRVREIRTTTGAVKRGKIVPGAILDGPLGLHFMTGDRTPYLVDNIFALGAPVVVRSDGDRGEHDTREGRELFVSSEAHAVFVDGITSIFPNPFNPATTIRFSLANASRVTIAVYGVNGDLVRTLVDGNLRRGDHTVEWDGTDAHGRGVATGVYFTRMVTGSFKQTRKIVLLK